MIINTNPSKLLLHNLYQVSDLLVVLSLYEPFSEIALYSHVHHLFLLTG